MKEINQTLSKDSSYGTKEPRFTTTNPSNRFIRMTNLKDNNNLRDFYFRDIILGEQSEEVYDPTNNAEIALAFREAGDSSD